MKSFYLLILVYFCSAFAHKPLTNATPVDIEKIDVLVLYYINILQKTISDKEVGSFNIRASNYFENPFVNEHVYDLSTKLPKEFISAYFSDAAKSNIKTLDVEFEETEIVDCKFFDQVTSKTFMFVSIPKTLKWNDGRTSHSKHYIKIDISTNDYKIEEVCSQETAKSYYFSKCLNKFDDVEKFRELSKKTENLYSKLTEQYGNKEYINALITANTIFKMNPNHQATLDALEALKSFISSSSIENKLTTYLNNRDLKSATTLIELIEKHVIDDSNLIQKWKFNIKDVKTQMQNEFDYEKANYFFENEMYQKALPIYLELISNGFQNPDISKKIEECKDSDPQLIQKRIKEAYQLAVKSKKNYKNTFKTYYKYENSGYLKATNYHFMCLMMIGKGNKSLLREMNITPNQAKNMAINYFYKARNMGYNNKDIEYMIFTKNFNKNRKL